MRCEDTLRQLDDYLDGSLPLAMQETVSGHLQCCAGCRQKFEQAQQLLLALQAMPVAPPMPGYAQRVTGFLSTAEKPASRLPVPLWFATGFATAMVAVLAVWFLLSMPTSRLSGTTVAAITLHVVPHQVRKVDLVFNSPAHIKQAVLRLELPDGVELDGYAKRRVLRWQTELKQGSNRLSLPLIAKGHAVGTLTASISHNGKTRTFKVNIVTNGTSSQRIPLNQTV